MNDLMMDLGDNLEKYSDNENLNESDEDIDENCVTEFTKVRILHEANLKKKAYVLHISSTKSSTPNIAAAQSDRGVKIFKLERELIEIWSVHNSEKVIDVKFQSDSENLLWTATSNGNISLWDLRNPDKNVSTFTDTTDDKIEKDRQFNCIDISANGRLLCAGTDVFEGDSYILFWDIRNVKLLGAFWESHTDDITQVKFHPINSDQLMSSSTDGLINIYDLSQQCEDDALIDTFNTELSVEKLNWYEKNSKSYINCLTHTSDVQIWETEGVQPVFSFKREDIAKGLKRTSHEYVYVVDVISCRQNQFILAGSNAQNGECVRGMKLDKDTLKPFFQLDENKQRITSCSYIENDNLLITGGEKGVLNVWKLPDINCV